ncbi:IS6 family transposase [Streptomyces sp. NPDC007205]|uniref:IS6 family transposase n=1 Tax=Streptomyces sp. NPDC007205 TaxID=3154316 RepID=UPI0033E63505
MDTAVPPYKGFRFPPEVIAHAVWLVSPFPAELNVAELLFERGIQVSYEAIRLRCERFGPAYAAGLRRRQPRPGDRWHPDEVFIKVNGRMRFLRRAVDQDGNVLDILVTDRRDAKAAKRFFHRLLKGLEYVPRVIVTDKLRSSGAAHREVIPSVEHRSSKYLNNRAGNSHLPARRREYPMQGFRRVGTTQRFLASFSRNSPHFRPHHHLWSRCRSVRAWRMR